MKTNAKLILCYLFIAFLVISCETFTENRIKTAGPEVVEFRVLPFELNQVKLLEGPFKKATELNVKSLLNYEPDRLLAKFRTEAGLEAKAEHYHGWEDATIAGHSLGHYLTACAMMYQTTGDTQFLDRVNYIVDELEIIQNADSDGYIGAFPEGKRILEEEVAKGDIRSAGFDLNGIWVPYYTQHKVMGGLRDAYHLCGNEKAIEIEKIFADWLEGIVIDMPDSSVQKMLHCEHGGINEVLAQLYGDTGDERYLKMSMIFHHKVILDSLLAGKDILPGKHANTQIPKLTGLARRYELTGDTDDRKTAEFFWDRMVHYHTYVTGGNGNNEYLGEPGKLRNRLGTNTTESCNVYNMLKLTRHLFTWEASAEVADYYERALFNHILSSQHPEDGRVIYNLSIDMGGRKLFQDPYWFTCCVGTGMENHSKYGRNIFFYNDKELFVSQFIAAELNWEEKGLIVRQLTAYPEEQGTRLEFDCNEPVRITLQIRYPAWAENGVELSVNGKRKKVKQEPGSFISINKTWEKGDFVEMKIPFTLRLETMPDDSNRIAVFHGPVVLAGDLGPEDDTNVHSPLYVPVFMTKDRNPENWIEPVEGKVNTFNTINIGRPGDVELRPFYTFYDRRYSIFWDLFTEEDWKSREANYKAQLKRKKELETLTVDFVQPGEMQPERDHNFKGERTYARSFKERRNREARSGWFSFDMTILPDKPVNLVVEYWGGFPGSKTFDILVNGEVIATENISNKKDGEFILIQYDIPENITRGKNKVTVKFESHPGNMAGPVFGVRMIKI
ncbi:MAG: glycoside hydrolase family 127 protein [Bacteroidales bacterium]|nr:MAG: glycoside hydrolase family 127 protein [Bacteroidales bacterium]